MDLYPAIDLLGGRAVRLHQGDYAKVTVYDEDPVARARAWKGRVPRLHVVDLEGARQGRAAQTDLVRAIVHAFGPGVQVGGGVRTREAFESYLALGAARIILGTAAVEHTDLVKTLAREHPGVVVVAVDAKDGIVATQGWTKASTITAVDLARSFSDVPLGAVLYTDVARDGTEIGPNLEATARLARDSGLAVIASGGVGTIAHLTALTAAGVSAAIVGRALYESRFTLEEALAACVPQ